MNKSLILSNFFRKIRKADESWIQRKRSITTLDILNISQKSSINRRGIRHIIFDEDKKISAAAICKAKQKLPPRLFKTLNYELVNENSSNTQNVFAIDGSKVHVPPSFKTIYDIKSRTNDKIVPRPAKRPIMMLSSVLNVNTKVCANFSLTKHFNERKSAKFLVSSVGKEGDVFIFDRGYYSRDLLQHILEERKHVLFRLKTNASSDVKRFFHSKKSEQKILINGQTLRLVKYMIDGLRYVCLTSLLNESKNEIKTLYSKRWKVEEHFKRLKSHLNIEHIVARKLDILKQELEMRVLIDSLAQLLRYEDAKLDPKQKKTTYLERIDYYIPGLFKTVLNLISFKMTLPSLNVLLILSFKKYKTPNNY